MAAINVIKCLKKRSLAIVFFCLCSVILFSQPSKLGVPFVKNYTVDEYSADNQNWAIVQDFKGNMYFANNWGVLGFNGSKWNIIASVNNFSNVRSLAINNTGRIFVGAFNEFGILNNSLPGIVYYESLVSKIPLAYRKFNDVWQIWQTARGVYFQSSYCIYKYYNDSITAISYNTEARKSFLVNDRIFLKFADGMRELANDSIIDIPAGKAFGPLYIAFMLPFEKNKILVGSETNGLFIYDYNSLVPYPVAVDDLIKKNKLFCGSYTPDGMLALGTVHAGLLLTDSKGHALLHLNTENGLQNNTILAMRFDNIGNLWLTLDRGIDYVELASPFTKINNTQIDGNIYSICHYNENLYVATHHGLFYQSWKLLNNSPGKIEAFKQVSGVSEINWSLNEIDGTLFLGHDNGAFIIENNTARKISDVKGGWTFRKLKQYPGFIIEGTYNGLVIFKKEQHIWAEHKVLTLNESCRIIEEDTDGNIWITSGYNGVYKLALNKNADSITHYQLYSQSEGFPESIYFGVFKVKGEVVFGTQRGVYAYNRITNKMEPHKLLYPFFKETHVRKLLEDKAGNIWFMNAGNTGYLKLASDGSYIQIHTPFQKITNKQLAGFENMSFVDNDNVMIGTKSGIINFSHKIKRDYQLPFHTLLDMAIIRPESDSTVVQTSIYPPHTENSNEQPIVIKYSNNAFRFKFSATFFENTSEIEYRYILDRFDDDWSPWLTKNEKEYTNIPEGHYTFRVKSRNVYGYESTEASIKIIVLPPWYRSTWAYSGYILLGLFIFWLIIFIKNLQFKKEKRGLEKEKLKAIRLKMAEHQQEKLANELQNKNKELATITMNLVQKNEVIMKIRDKVTELSMLFGEKEKKRLANLEKLIDDEINDDSYWEQFEQHFNQIHDDFIKRFKTEHTTLTHKDLKMCAYLRMNLSNKEIATLLNITLRGVEASRLRIRRKINLDKDLLLTEYILRF